MKNISYHYINGEFVSGDGTDTQGLFNPDTGEEIGVVKLASKTDTNRAVQAAKDAFISFSQTTLKERGEYLQKLYLAVMEREDDLNNAAVLEYGSPISATKGRTRFSAQLFLDTKEAMESFQFETQLPHATIVYQPHGVIAAITPWNANYTHICGKLAPAIAAGSTIVIKPSELSAMQTQILIECFHHAGLPKGVINVINGSGPVVGAALSSHPDVGVLTFTGSTGVGKTIIRQAAETMKRVTLELGGKSPNIILQDADLEKAIPMAIMIAFSNSGQACHAGSRLLVPENHLPEIKSLLVKAVDALKIGRLQEPDSAIGPMVSFKQYETVQGYIQSGIDQGAELIAGGLGHPEGLEGYYVKPTVFVNVTSDMVIAREEIFGPVLSVLTYRSEDEAVEIANDSRYGLSAYISTADVEHGRRIASRIAAGRVLINTVVNKEPLSPFGGFKESGLGRTSGIYGILEYLEPKVIAI